MAKIQFFKRKNGVRLSPVLIGGFLFICLFFAQSAAANAGSVTRLEPGDSVQQAIANAENGDRIVLGRGIYRENVTISKPVVLEGEDGAVIDGGGKGSIIEITSDRAVVRGLTLRHSGQTGKDAGLHISGSQNVVENNTLELVHFGVYVEEADSNVIRNNRISSYPVHFSRRGNGIHLFKGTGNEAAGNRITGMQDGIYFDFAKNSRVEHNQISDSRYGLHFMFAEGGKASGNVLSKNITGLMVMGTKHVAFEENTITRQLNYRGFGVLIFDSEAIRLLNNKVEYNSTGLSLQDARDSIIKGNLFAGNHIGIHLKDENSGNTVSGNRFSGNVVQTKIVEQKEPLDDGSSGNYWDDYRGFDTDGDGIGEIPYESGTMYDRLVFKNPELQFFFESPAIKMWAAAEKWMPSLASDKGVDRYPLAKPPAEDERTGQEEPIGWQTGMFAMLLLSITGAIVYGSVK